MTPLLTVSNLSRDFTKSLEQSFNEAMEETNVVNFMEVFNEEEKKQSQK